MKTAGAMLTVRAESADIAGLLGKASASGVSLYEISTCDDPLQVRFQISRKDYSYLKYLAARRGDTLWVEGKSGRLWLLSVALQRPVLCTGLLLLMVLSLWLPGRVLFVQVSGNRVVPAKQILQAAEENGMHFGAARKEVRSERLKNGILEKIPQLQWAGVNTYGCVAVISVEERQQAPAQAYTVSSIVSVRDGIVLQATALKGTLLCKVGQAVQKGEILISGYTEGQLLIQATRAEGEVYARTERSLTVSVPLTWQQRGDMEVVEKKYGLIFGKKQINFSKDSGIYDSGCVKMYEANYLSLPGGYQLPVALTCETIIRCAELAGERSPEEADASARIFTGEYLRGHMVAGTILSAQTESHLSENVLTVTGKYACVEMIGIPRGEEILQ